MALARLAACTSPTSMCQPASPCLLPGSPCRRQCCQRGALFSRFGGRARVRHYSRAEASTTLACEHSILIAASGDFCQQFQASCWKHGSQAKILSLSAGNVPWSGVNGSGDALPRVFRAMLDGFGLVSFPPGALSVDRGDTGKFFAEEAGVVLRARHPVLLVLA